MNKVNLNKFVYCYFQPLLNNLNIIFWFFEVKALELPPYKIQVINQKHEGILLVFEMVLSHPLLEGNDLFCDSTESLSEHVILFTHLDSILESKEAWDELVAPQGGQRVETRLIIKLIGSRWAILEVLQVHIEYLREPWPENIDWKFLQECVHYVYSKYLLHLMLTLLIYLDHYEAGVNIK